MDETRNHISGPLATVGEYTYGVPQVRYIEHGAKLQIGKFCSIANTAYILVGGEHDLDAASTYPFAHFPGDFPGAEHEMRPATRGDVVIGNDVWIGEGAMILSGTTIEDGAVIGARAVVRGWVLPYAVMAGNPARKLRTRFDAAMVSALLAIKWWDWPIEKIQEFAPLLCGDVKEFLKKAGAA